MKPVERCKPVDYPGEGTTLSELTSEKSRFRPEKMGVRCDNVRVAIVAAS